MANEIEKQFDAIIGTEHTNNVYHANHLIKDKIVDKKSHLFGKKGESFYLKNGNQYYFKPKMKVAEFVEVKDENGNVTEVETGNLVENKEFFRVKWYQLDSIVGEGDYGKARYIGINASIFGKIGKLTFTNKKWIFHLDYVGTNGEILTDKYPLNNPESVELLD